MIAFYSQMDPKVQIAFWIVVALTVYGYFRYQAAECDKENCKVLYWMFLVPSMMIAMFAGAYVQFNMTQL
jgi:hypothetical protein